MNLPPTDEQTLTGISRTLFRNKTFVLLFFAGALGIFPIFVPPYCMPTFAESIGISSSTGAGLVAAFNAASAVGRISSGFLSDKIGSLNVALISMSLLGTTMFLIWPFASTLGVLILFVLVAGVAVGGFFSMMPTVVGHIFGSANMSVTMGMILTSWTFGYLLVCRGIHPLQQLEILSLTLIE
jgi:MFS family permease